MSTLIICEKANAADKIAYFLSNGSSKLTRRGRVKVHNFSMGGEEYSVVGLRGHVVSFDYEKKYNNWKDTELKKLIWAEPIRQATAADIVSTIQSIRPKKVIIATDYDREGELIGVEALDIIDWPPEKAKRAKFSALTGEEIRTAFQNLSDVDTKLADAGMARQYIDLAWGAVLTRFVSLTTGRMGRDFLSIGRVQSPTLALIVDRENEILSFVPKPFWEISALLGKDNINVLHTKNPFWEEMEAIKSFEKSKQAEKAKVEEWSKRDENSRPPPPFNTTMFITEATKLGLGARQAMDIAEDLYTDGWISYPRTDNTVYPRSLSLKGVLKKLSQGEFKKEAEELLTQDRIRATRGRTQTTDHPPIYPVRGATSEQIKGVRWKVYELVARRFMATVAPDAILEKTEGKMDLNGEKFQISGKFIKYAGWTAYYPYFRFDEIVLPTFKKGQMLEVNKVSKARKHTRPPPRYSQGSLIQKMEDLNLGTKSTRHEIIQKLFERGYVRKPLVPTSTGMALIEMLREGAEEMTRHHMTATLEDEMSAITDGDKTLELVVEDSRKMLSQVLGELQERKESVRDTMKEADKEGSKVGQCSICGGELMVIKPGRKRFVGCSNYPSCKNTFPLPQQGMVQATGKNCPTCGAPFVKILTKGRRPWEICLNMECPSKKKEIKKEVKKEVKKRSEEAKQSSAKSP